MTRRKWWAAGVCLMTVACGGAPSLETLPNEDAYRANNRGVALLERFDYAAAVEAFSDAVALDDSLGIARLNLALALFHAQDLDAAEREATEAMRLLPEALQPPYLLGLIARSTDRPDEAIRAFATVLESDPDDVGANINLGQIHLEAQNYPDAIAYLRVAYAGEPYNVTAVYNLGLALARTGETDEGRRLLEQAQALRATTYAVTYGPGYLNEGRYAEAMVSTGAEAGLVDTSPPTASFEPVPLPGIAGGPTDSPSPFGRRFARDELSGAAGRAVAAGLGGGVTLVDFDVDGDIDLFLASANGQRLVRHDIPDGWMDVTEQSGLDTSGDAIPIGAISADYDNDQRPDLFVLRYGGNALYHNEGEGRFRDVTAEAGVPPYPYLPGAAAFSDVDHDGDVDLLVAGLADLEATRERLDGGTAVFPAEFVPAPLQLLRNNQDGTFTEITTAAGLDSVGHAVAIVPTDFDNRRDVDLLVVEHDTSPRLFMNLRDSTFRDVAAEVGLSPLGDVRGGLTAVTAADVNKDEFPDFAFAGSEDAVVALSDGRGRFSIVPAPGDIRGATALRFIDHDNDGLLDLLSWSSTGPRLARNLGSSWNDVTDSALVDMGTVPSVTTAHALAVADVDGDGDSDIVTAGAGLVTIGDNSGDSRHTSVRVSVHGLVSNRLGVGAKVQVRAGSLRSRLETSAATPAAGPADLVFGLGPRPGAEVARVLWPSGILQAEVPEQPSVSSAGAPPATFLPSSLVVQELDREPSSCPLLFTWNGTEFEFVTDFLGAGEMGYWHGPGVYNTPDPVEYVRIEGDQLVPKDGRFEIRLTNELEEAVLFDRLQLIVITHPEDVEVYPNEGMATIPKPHRIHGVRAPHPPLGAIDDDGTDVTDTLARLDERYPAGFRVSSIRGYADQHTLTLDLGPREDSSVLLLTGWTDYAFSSDNVAASQAGLAPMAPMLEVRNPQGRWRPATEIGIPVGRPQTIAIDLADILQPGEREVRVVTNMRIFWDRILVGARAPVTSFGEHHLDPVTATLRERGFSAEIRPESGAPTRYDYARVALGSPWKSLTGRYTREGDVLELVSASDDMFAITKDGDEVALTFDAEGLAPLRDGWTRTYLLHAVGFSKEMDINSATPDTLEPLPFQAMSSYPYAPPEQYPDTMPHRRYRDTYNTRTVVRSVPSLDGLR